ncbi:4F2 cell-surface antigen heavy chain-like, partial [Vidua macroura]|uniref:4F2 cell-surface antigen heavy chain-like n=1 Tax=Vidua macroura TaxID=187451 RepID=UPI0023A7C287
PIFPPFLGLSVFRVLVGGTRQPDPWKVLRGPGGPQLLLGPFLQPLEPKGDSESLEGALRNLLNFLSSNFTSSVGLGWSVGSPWEAWVSPSLRLQQLLLLWGLPGTPVLSYGDELGLQRLPKSQQLLPMPWESIEAPKTAGNGSEPPELELCTTLAALRAHERSLLLGEASVVPAGPAVAVLRRWDQSERFLLVLNPDSTPLKPFSGRREPRDPREPPLPPSATLSYSTAPRAPGEQQLLLEELTVGAHEGVLLSFPYSPE